MMRLTVSVAPVDVQRRENEVARLGRGQRDSIVSWSRISPTRITSGSWRSACFSAAANGGVVADLALRRSTDWCGWMNSIGSSMVMMW